MNKLHLLSFDKSYTRNMCHERNIVNPWLIQMKCSSSSRVLNATNDRTILKNNLIPIRSEGGGGQIPPPLEYQP